MEEVKLFDEALLIIEYVIIYYKESTPNNDVNV